MRKVYIKVSIKKISITYFDFLV